MPSELPVCTAGLVCAIAGLIVAGASAQAPSACAEALIDQSRRANLNPPYEARGEYYCDGAASAMHGGGLEMRSMTLGPINFGSERLEISLQRKANFFVRGWDLRPAGAYRLDGDLSDGVVLVDLDAAIRPMGLQADDLGLYAWRDDGLSRVYAPVSAGSEGPVVVTLRSAARLREIRFAALCPGATNDCGITAPAQHENTDGGALIHIKLPSEVGPGRHRLTIVAAGTARGVFPTGAFDLDL